MRQLLQAYRRQLANYDSLLAYSLLGLVGGIASGLIVLAFELAIQETARLWGVAGGEDFESLPRWLLFALPVSGAIALGAVFSMLQPEDREIGIVHVLSRMHSHYGALPLRNAIVQFVGGAFALATGQSGGREGPGVHLGGAINSQLGQHLGLPNNSLRVLIACGTAGGIAAAFGTPLAGVIFAMEVIVAEYTVVGFLPVMLAAVSASVISRYFAKGGVMLAIPEVAPVTLPEMPLVIGLGLACGLAVTLFIYLLRLTSRLSHWPVMLRFALGGLLTGALALEVPHVLGIGYDSLAQVLRGELAWSLLLALAACKLLCTAVSCGVGMPIGLIGPNLLIGACLGGLAGMAGAALLPETPIDATLYVVIGMAAAMGAVLNAPLAAILAALELTDSINIGFAALLAIVAATLTSHGIFRQRSAHQTALRQLQRMLPDDPLNQLLHRTDVTTRMDASVSRIHALLPKASAEPLLMAAPAWCLVSREGEDLYLVQGGELSDWLRARAQEEEADLTQADIRRWSVANVPVQATLRQALDIMRRDTVEAVCVYGRGRGGERLLQGVVTRDSIEKFTLANL
ncbi:MAG: chloride channel protein [Pseudomonadota bacterium]